MYDKLTELNKRIDKLTGQLILVVFFYLITSKTTIQSFQVGPITINDVSIFGKLLPILFSYLLFDVVVTSGHKTEVFMTVKLISLSLYRQEINHKELELNRHGLFTRLLLPFSYSTELSKLITEKVNIVQALFGFIIFLPVLSLIILPFFLEYYMLKDVYQHYYSDTLGKVSFYLSIWISLLTIYYLVNNAVTNFRDQRAELL